MGIGSERKPSIVWTRVHAIIHSSTCLIWNLSNYDQTAPSSPSSVTRSANLHRLVDAVRSRSDSCDQARSSSPSDGGCVELSSASNLHQITVAIGRSRSSSRSSHQSDGWWWNHLTIVAHWIGESRSFIQLELRWTV